MDVSFDPAILLLFSEKSQASYHPSIVDYVIYWKSEIYQSLVDSECSLILHTIFLSYLAKSSQDLPIQYHILVQVESTLKLSY